jgi:hypothetical protein
MCSLYFFILALATYQQLASINAANKVDFRKECARARTLKEWSGLGEHYSLHDINEHAMTRQLNLSNPLERKSGFNIADCCNPLAARCLRNGVYTGRVNGESTEMLCDMDGGWTVIQRRKDGSQDFNQNWRKYAKGFGDVNGEFWLGNDKIAALTNSGPKYELRIDMESFEGLKKYANYNNFKIGFADEKYKIKSLGEFRGSTVDTFTSYHLTQSFSTYDQDNDKHSGHCAEDFKSGWWFNDCAAVNLNKPWINNGHDGIVWYKYKNNDEGLKPLKSTTMKIRPTECDI